MDVNKIISEEAKKLFSQKFYEEQVEEGTGDVYAEKHFGIPDVNPQWEKRADQSQYDSSMGEMVGYTYHTFNDVHVPIFRNPKSLLKFEPEVRAVSDVDGNIYVAQKNDDFVHGAFTKVMRNDPYNTSVNITWHRVENSNIFGISDTFTARAHNYKEEVGKRLDLLREKHPTLRFVPDFYLHIDSSDEGMEKRMQPMEYFEEGVGDRYAEKAFGIPDANRQYAAKGVPDADMGEKISPIWGSNYGSEKKFQGYIYKNPKTLRGFDEDVRAIGMDDGDLYVAQQDGDFIHVDMELAIEKIEGPLGEYYEFHRVGTKNEFGASDTLVHKIQDYNVDAEYIVDELNARHPQFEFSKTYYEYLRNSVNEIIKEEVGNYLNDNFWKWFGDSKVVDNNSKPLRVYHGTTADFNEFVHGGWHGNILDINPSYYFHSNPEGATNYAEYEGGNVMPVYLKIENPRIFRKGDDWVAFKEDIMSGRYDGAVYDTVSEQGDPHMEIYRDWEKYGDVFAVFNKNQIKSATGNDGGFTNSPDITKEGVGDKYLQSKGVMPDSGDEFEKRWQQKQKSDSRDAINGEVVGQVVVDDKNAINGKGVINVYKNPKSLENFDKDVRAISDNEGNLYVGQFNSNYLHDNIGDAVGIPDTYDTTKYMTWVRVGDTNKFYQSYSFRAMYKLSGEDWETFKKRMAVLNQKQVFEFMTAGPVYEVLNEVEDNANHTPDEMPFIMETVKTPQEIADGLRRSEYWDRMEANNPDYYAEEQPILANVDMELADKAFRNDHDFYIGKDDKGIGNRKERVMIDIKNGTLTYAPDVSIRVSHSGVPVLSFGDGRHRFAVLRDLGVESINLTFNKDSEQYIHLLQR